MPKLTLALAHHAFAWMRFDHFHRGSTAFLVLVLVAILSAVLLVRANSS